MTTPLTCPHTNIFINYTSITNWVGLRDNNEKNWVHQQLHLKNKWSMDIVVRKLHEARKFFKELNTQTSYFTFDSSLPRQK